MVKEMKLLYKSFNEACTTCALVMLSTCISSKFLTPLIFREPGLIPELIPITWIIIYIPVYIASNTVILRIFRNFP